MHQDLSLLLLDEIEKIKTAKSIVNYKERCSVEVKAAVNAHVVDEIVR